MSMLGILLLAISAFFIWVALRVVDKLTKIRKQLREIRNRLLRAPSGGLRRKEPWQKSCFSAAPSFGE